MVGKGVGRWNTMPMRRRSWIGSTPASYTSAPSSSTAPGTQPPSDSSCMRLRQRRTGLLPPPAGPDYRGGGGGGEWDGHVLHHAPAAVQGREPHGLELEPGVNGLRHAFA